MRKDRTREERRRRQTAARVLLVVLVVLCIVTLCSQPAGGQVPADEYLASIGADNAQREHVMSLYEEWGE